MDDPETVQWRRDASTSRTVRVLWALGVGTFLAMISLIVFWRVFDLAREFDAHYIVGAVFAGVLATILVFLIAPDTHDRIQSLTRNLPVSSPSPDGLARLTDAIWGGLAMGGVIGGLMGLGRLASQTELLEIGAGPFTGLAALTLPLALVAIVLSVFLQSVGMLDLGERRLYLYDPDEAVDLEVIEDVSVRTIGDAALVTLEYTRLDGEYVPGPRRLVVPPNVAHEVQAVVRSRP